MCSALSSGPKTRTLLLLLGFRKSSWPDEATYYDIPGRGTSRQELGISEVGGRALVNRCAAIVFY